MDKIDYSEMFKTEEVSEILDRINNSRKNRILWRIFRKLYSKKGSFVNLFGQLMYYGGLYDAYVIAKNYFDRRTE